jgi:hypothetical protein
MRSFAGIVMVNKNALLWFAAIAVLLCIVAVSPASANNLLLNGGFETPVVSSTSQCGTYFNCEGFHSYPAYPNSDIGGWTVIGNSDIDCSGGPCVPNGAPAPVMLLNNSYTEPFGTTSSTLHFTSHGGHQAIDLTGEGNQNSKPGIQDGIKQTVNTVKGQTYDLNFWLGHQDGTAPGYTAGDASIDLFLNGLYVTTFTNGMNKAGDINWAAESFDFVATGNSTTVAFINSTSLGNNYAGLDDVSLSSVPEPASLLLVGAGLCGFMTRRLRKL